jgi:predicted RNA-binding Zn ribbon-like protein
MVVKMSDAKRTLETLELVGGVLCLDFVNTVNSHDELEHDYIASYADLVDWAAKMELFSPTQAKTLKQKASQESNKAEKILNTTKDARETIFRVFSAIAKGTNPKEADLNLIAGLYQEAIGNGQLVKTDGLFIFKWEPHKSLDGVLWQIVASAQSLLSAKEVARVKECPNCGWLFLDTSKNQSRRWCSMNTCGVHDKMRRYHKKLREK